LALAFADGGELLVNYQQNASGQSFEWPESGLRYPVGFGFGILSVLQCSIGDAMRE
tara:strand:- start:153343 stop:153510 length:168 start_codon:yes stop_codon:yes gene_type:complete